MSSETLQAQRPTHNIHFTVGLKKNSIFGNKPTKRQKTVLCSRAVFFKYHFQFIVYFLLRGYGVFISVNSAK